MKDMIKEIVDIDHEAQQITDEAQQEKLNSADEISKRREEIRTKYLARARKRIEKNEPVERAAAEKKWAVTEKHYTEVRKKLEADYSTHGDQWVKELVSRVLGA
ncbi:MAG TPA: hypothetical protein DHW78_08040 [Ruminococcaceae bacterium]|jgi:predicted  nucleic acid-binding Zn-ribbon protein|nr:hypothetical protein [Oscillospiraceae bacterium]HCA71172.1 hypothetical protein [Oscillospiraceae bacterium]HCC01138.1 hypothetical protein [Oscillospiraceae bacterium]HCM24254.1 hypothetical protein [Oscillospiraceae bacterium]